MYYREKIYLKFILLLLCFTLHASESDSESDDESAFDDPESYFWHFIHERDLGKFSSSQIEIGRDYSLKTGRNYSQDSEDKWGLVDVYTPRANLQTFILCTQSVAGNKDAERRVRELAPQGASFDLFYNIRPFLGNLLFIRNNHWASFFSSLPLLTADNSMDTVFAVAQGRDERQRAITEKLAAAVLSVDLIRLVLKFDETSPQAIQKIRQMRRGIDEHRSQRE